MTKQQQQQQHLYGEYINPMIDQYSLEKENPLVLMAQACNNIGKEITSSSSSLEGKKSLKRTIPRSSISSSAKKISSVNPSSSYTFNSLFYQQLNKRFSSPIFDYSLLSTMNSSAFSPTIPRTSYLMDSILSSPFVCNWIESNRFCGKRFINHYHLLEHLCKEHSSIKSSYID